MRRWRRRDGRTDGEKEGGGGGDCKGQRSSGVTWPVLNLINPDSLIMSKSLRCELLQMVAAEWVSGWGDVTRMRKIEREEEREWGWGVSIHAPGDITGQQC